MTCCSKCAELEERVLALEKLFEINPPIDKKKSEKARPDNLMMVVNYFKEQRIKDPELQAEKFYNHYEANGWVRGKTKIKDWKACVKTWEFPRDNAIQIKINKDDLFGGRNEDISRLRY